ncbi:MAG TPA: T9SS type A sorting domain-containing protein [Bacteroidales bacterium]|nr:T9SS type A sorting domain-containing protein [Bacteroidales bacterium]
MKRIIECFLIVICGCVFCNAQQAISAGGGEATGTGGTLSYTIGQTDYITTTSTSGVVMQGVQQPFELLVISGIEEAKGISLEISVYPNPTSNFLRLKVANVKLQKLSYQLYDLSGSLLVSNEIRDKEIIIHTGNLAPAAYYLRISDNQKGVKTFIIIKSQ